MCVRMCVCVRVNAFAHAPEVTCKLVRFPAMMAAPLSVMWAPNMSRAVRAVSLLTQACRPVSVIPPECVVVRAHV